MGVKGNGVAQKGCLESQGMELQYGGKGTWSGEQVVWNPAVQWW